MFLIQDINLNDEILQDLKKYLVLLKFYSKNELTIRLTITLNKTLGNFICKTGLSVSIFIRLMLKFVFISSP